MSLWDVFDDNMVLQVRFHSLSPYFPSLLPVFTSLLPYFP